MTLGQTSRYNGNHNNLTASLGVISQQDQEKLRKINLPRTSKAYIILSYAKMNVGKYVTYHQVAQLNPQKFLGPNGQKGRVNETLKNLYEKQLIQQNPDNPEEFMITLLGIKYLFCKKLLKKR